MGRKALVPITPSVLAWALQESGFQRADVVARLRVEEDVLNEWLAGTSQPSLTQFRQLARVLRRPTATFLLPAPPRSTRPSVEFRHPPGEPDRAIRPDELLRIREVDRLQRAVAWLLEELGEPGADLPKVPRSAATEQAGRRGRALLAVTLDDQKAAKNASDAFRMWRSAFERIDILVLLLPMGGSAARGFSLWNARAPAIVVNSHWNPAARTFTLFHEFAHLLTRTNSICVEDGGVRARVQHAADLERWCEQFAAAALMPHDDLRRLLPDPSTKASLDTARRVATRYRVSLRAATLRLIGLGYAGWNLYKSIPPASDEKRPGGAGGGRNRPQKRLDEYGRRTARIFTRAVRADVISAADAMRYLDVTDQNLAELDQLAS